MNRKLIQSHVSDAWMTKKLGEQQEKEKKSLIHPSLQRATISTFPSDLQQIVQYYNATLTHSLQSLNACGMCSCKLFQWNGQVPLCKLLADITLHSEMVCVCVCVCVDGGGVWAPGVKSAGACSPPSRVLPLPSLPPSILIVGVAM